MKITEFFPFDVLKIRENTQQIFRVFSPKVYSDIEDQLAKSAYTLRFRRMAVRKNRLNHSFRKNRFNHSSR